MQAACLRRHAGCGSSNFPRHRGHRSDRQLPRGHHPERRRRHRPALPGRPATASSTENAGTPASAAVDGNTGTRWSSAFSDPHGCRSTWAAPPPSARWCCSGRPRTPPHTRSRSPRRRRLDHHLQHHHRHGWHSDPQHLRHRRFVRILTTARANPVRCVAVEFQVFGSVGATCGSDNAGLNRTATASSTENTGTPRRPRSTATPATRWASVSATRSAAGRLGSNVSVCPVVLQWEAAYATAFQSSSPPTPRVGPTPTRPDGTGGTQTLAVTGTPGTCGSTAPPGHPVGLLAVGVWCTRSARQHLATATTTQTTGCPGSGHRTDRDARAQVLARMNQRPEDLRSCTATATPRRTSAT